MGNDQSIKAPLEKKGTRVETVDCLRGIAVSMVVLMHLFVGANSGLQGGHLIEPVLRYGWLGVDVFFVISGFVIPYSLFHSNYRTTQFGRFLLKRIIRLDPPYVLSFLFLISFTFVLHWTLPSATPPFIFDWHQFFLHFGYLNALFDRPWYNPVFWTLGVEFQYYLFVGFAFPFLSSTSKIGFLVFATCVASVSLISSSDRFFTTHILTFLIGIQVFRLKCNLSTAIESASVLTLLGAANLVMNGPPAAIAGISSAILIGWLRLSWRPLSYLGAISYSLYLLHIPIGAKLVNLGSRFTHNDLARIVCVSCAVIASIVAAEIFFRLVERPSQLWSGRIKYKELDAKAFARQDA